MEEVRNKLLDMKVGKLRIGNEREQKLERGVIVR